MQVMWHYTYREIQSAEKDREKRSKYTEEVSLEVISFYLTWTKKPELYIRTLLDSYRQILIMHAVIIKRPLQIVDYNFNIIARLYRRVAVRWAVRVHQFCQA